MRKLCYRFWKAFDRFNKIATVFAFLFIIDLMLFSKFFKTENAQGLWCILSMCGGVFIIGLSRIVAMDYEAKVSIQEADRLLGDLRFFRAHGRWRL
jgi:hypothetical protein